MTPKARIALVGHRFATRSEIEPKKFQPRPIGPDPLREREKKTPPQIDPLVGTNPLPDPVPVLDLVPVPDLVPDPDQVPDPDLVPVPDQVPDPDLVPVPLPDPIRNRGAIFNAGSMWLF